MAVTEDILRAIRKQSQDINNMNKVINGNIDYVSKNIDNKIPSALEDLNSNIIKNKDSIDSVKQSLNNVTSNMFRYSQYNLNATSELKQSVLGSSSLSSFNSKTAIGKLEDIKRLLISQRDIWKNYINRTTEFDPRAKATPEQKSDKRISSSESKNTQLKPGFLKELLTYGLLGAMGLLGGSSSAAGLGIAGGLGALGISALGAGGAAGLLNRLLNNRKNEVKPPPLPTKKPTPKPTSKPTKPVRPDKWQDKSGRWRDSKGRYTSPPDNVKKPTTKPVTKPTPTPKPKPTPVRPPKVKPPVSSKPVGKGLGKTLAKGAKGVPGLGVLVTGGLAVAEANEIAKMTPEEVLQSSKDFSKDYESQSALGKAGTILMNPVQAGVAKALKQTNKEIEEGEKLTAELEETLRQRKEARAQREKEEAETIIPIPTKYRESNEKVFEKNLIEQQQSNQFMKDFLFKFDVMLDQYSSRDVYLEELPSKIAEAIGGTNNVNITNINAPKSDYGSTMRNKTGSK